MKIKEANVETSIVAIQLAHQGISYKQSAHQKKGIHSDSGVQNTMQLPFKRILNNK